MSTYLTFSSYKNKIIWYFARTRNTLEESVTEMKRILAVLAAVLLAVPAGAALAEEAPEAEEPVAEAPSGACAHEHTETQYYFDFPIYTPVDGESHAVSGDAMVTVVCLDCGAVLSADAVDNAREVRPHVFRNGRCALCGMEEPWEAADPAPEPEPVYAEPAQAEDAFVPPAEGPDPGFVSLNGRDLEQAGDTLVLRTGDRTAELVVLTQPIREEVARTGGFMTAEIEKQDDRHFSTSVRLYDASGAESVPDGQVVSLRVYVGNNGAPVTVSFTGPDGTVSAGEAGWVEGGNYWSVPWLGNGLYELIK